MCTKTDEDNRNIQSIQNLINANPTVVCSGGCNHPLSTATELWFENLDTNSWYCPSCIMKNPEEYPEWIELLKMDGTYRTPSE